MIENIASRRRPVTPLPGCNLLIAYDNIAAALSLAGGGNVFWKRLSGNTGRLRYPASETGI